MHEPGRYRAEVHQALIDLEPVLCLGVPVTTLRYNLFFSLACVLMFFAMHLLSLVSLLWMLMGVVLILGAAIGIHLLFLWCCRADVHLMDTLIIFVHYPPYLGPR